MKRLLFLVIMVLISVSLSAQKSKVRYNPKGTWKFENTSAPGGYSSGDIEIKYSRKKYTMSFVFSENGEIYQAEDVRFKNDSLQFSLNIQGLAMTSRSKFEQADKISGETSVMGNSVPFTLTRVKGNANLKK